MRGEKDPKRLQALRDRLYERGASPRARESKKAVDIERPTEEESATVPGDWQKKNASESQRPTPQAAQASSIPDTSAPQNDQTTFMSQKKRQSLRLKVIVAALFFFVAAVALSSAFIIFGGNTISSDNISVSINGPFTVGGGEIMNVQVGVINENNVPIESATLVIDYPRGTRSVDGDGNEKELYTERLPLDRIEPGESVNIPLKVRVYGEENDEQTIQASVEYRVEGSNSTFYKEAEPLRFKISSSPVVMSIQSVESLASGQEADVKIKIKSNAATKLSGLLVRAEYPNGFQYSSASPKPDSGQNAWLIDSIEPEETKTITVTGVALGTQSEAQVIKASLGTPSDRDKFNISSTLATADLEYQIEQPFIAGSIAVGGNNSGSVSIGNGTSQTVTVNVRNNLDETIYDGVVKARLSGNALPYTTVTSGNGFYDSNSHTVTWDVSSVPALRELAPGEGQNLTFNITPNVGTLTNAALSINGSLSARRASPNEVQETLSDSLKTEVRIKGQASLLASAGHNNGIFANTGPVPPQVGQKTSYTISMQVQTGSNGLSSTRISATLPTYVLWLDKVQGDGNITYNDSSRTLEWNPGSVSANSQATVSFGVSILPSTSQIGTTPILVGSQFLQATDLYTNDSITAEHEAVTTEMTSESGYGADNGVVQQ